MSVGVRKNFVFDEEVAEHLEKLAKDENKSMTKLLEELIEQRYKEIQKSEKLKALEDITGLFDGEIGEITIQKAKESMY